MEGGRGGGGGEGERKDATREPVSVLMLHEVFLFSTIICNHSENEI